ncbi:hypothetical protein GCM10027030_25810 [Luteococcus sediminum]
MVGRGGGRLGGGDGAAAGREGDGGESGGGEARESGLGHGFSFVGDPAGSGGSWRWGACPWGVDGLVCGAALFIVVKVTGHGKRLVDQLPHRSPGGAVGRA